MENDEEILSALSAILVNKGYSAKRVKSVSECLEEAVRFSPHLIVSKYLLEGLSGSRLVDLLRGMSHLKLIPIILYSNSPLEGDKENALASGANVFLSDVSDGACLPADSRRDTVLFVVPMREATASCVRPARERAASIAFATAYSTASA